MSTLAIIPARGGSKGLPRKNFVMLAGRPLIAWTVAAAREARLVDRVIVSTDDAEIAKIAQAHGAEVTVRPAEISDDTSTSESALLHVLEHLREAENYHPDDLVFLQCTSPLTLPEDIEGTLATMREAKADSALTVTEFHHFIWQQNAATGAADGVNHDKRTRPRRQDREAQWLETGAVYAMRTAGFLESRHRFFGKTVFHAVPRERAWEIDGAEDLPIAEMFLRARQSARPDSLPNPPAAIVFDFDGVFTDNKVHLSSDGQEGIVCDRSDGMGISRLRAAGIPMLVLSTEMNPILSHRCRKLELPFFHALEDKAKALSTWIREQGLNAASTIYVGNDINDLGCMRAVGWPVAVADAHPAALSAARITLKNPGGRGAIRELSDLILLKRMTS